MFSRILHIPAEAPLLVKTTIGGMPEILPGEIGFEGAIGPVSGYDVPPRAGLLWIRSPNGDRAIRNATAVIKGIDGHTVTMDLPGRCLIEMPAQVEIRGPAGLAILVTAWVGDTAGERGAAESVVGVGPHVIPLWATTLDAAGSLISFFDTTPAAIGVIAGPVVGLSIPPNADTMTLAGATDTAIFRQG